MSKLVVSPFAQRLNAPLIEQLPLRELKPYEQNPRHHSRRQIQKLAKLLSRFGIVVPIAVDDAGVIIDGHAVVKAAKLIGLHEAPVVRVSNLTETEKKALRLALNRAGEDAKWDRELLAKELRFLVDESFELDLTAFEVPEIEFVLNEHGLSGAEQAGPEDNIPEAPATKPPVSQTGDLWQLGKHRLLVGDARDPAAYARLMQGEQADMAFADVPYNVKVRDISGKGRIKHREFAMASGEMRRQEYAEFLAGCFQLMARHSAGGAVHFICTDGKHLAEMTCATEAAYSDQLALVVWDKMSAGMGGLYRNRFELIFVMKVGGGQIIDNVQLGKFGRNRSNVWSYRGLAGFGKDRRETLALHPTVKPTAMVADAILDVSRRGDIVLDPFAGSGTTVIAAEKTGRQARVMEIDPVYADTIIRRWQAYAGKNALHTGTGLSFEQLEEKRGAAA